MQISDFETVIGLEVHVQLNTASKLFCGDSTAFGAQPNTQTSIISLAHPGTLPRMNHAVLEKAIQLGIALGCKINPISSFDRKNYFYADLPKGYQTTQDRAPICLGGQVKIKSSQGSERLIRLHHIHLEEDAGKSIHDLSEHFSLIDLNRAGVPLLEIVTEPDLRSAAEASAFLENLQHLVRWLDISDGNMEEGSLRCDVNVSVRRSGDPTLGQRCEIKNVNSMRFARRAIEFETQRQIKILQSGGKVVQETRGFDPANGTTYAQREKEDAQDYRYFPEPDLPPFSVNDDFLTKIKTRMPTLPQQLALDFKAKYQLGEQDIAQILTDRETALFFQDCMAQLPTQYAKPMANFLIQRLKPFCTAQEIALASMKITPLQIFEYLQLIENQKITSSVAAQKLFPKWMENPIEMPAEIAARLQLFQENDSEQLEKIIEEVVSCYPEKVLEYRKGKKGLIGFFIGEAMKISGGKSDPKLVTKLFIKRISN